MSSVCCDYHAKIRFAEVAYTNGIAIDERKGFRKDFETYLENHPMLNLQELATYMVFGIGTIHSRFGMLRFVRLTNNLVRQRSAMKVKRRNIVSFEQQYQEIKQK